MTQVQTTTTKPQVPNGAPKKPTLREFLDYHKDKIQSAAAEQFRDEGHIRRLIEIAVVLVHRDVKGNLANCSRASILNCIQEAARLGLEIGGAQAHAYLVPYKDEATLSVSYRGLIALMLRSGEVTSARAHLVWRGDAFRYELGGMPSITHVPHLGDHGKGEWTHAYAVIRLKNGDLLLDVMTKAEILAVKARSKASGSGPWVTDEGEMARKTVLRRCGKYAPMQESIDEQIDADAIETTAINVADTPRGNEGLEELARKALGAPAQKESVPAAQQAAHATGQPDEEEIAAALAREAEEAKR